MARQRPPHERRILCTSCGGLLVVAGVAKSVNCHHCNGRVICEELQIDDYVAVRNLRTANRIHIKKRGHVVAAVWCEDLVVDGKLRGDAIALGAIHLTRRARVEGGLRGTSLQVEEGATVRGVMRIGPEHIPEHEALLAPTATEALDRLERDAQN